MDKHPIQEGVFCSNSLYSRFMVRKPERYSVSAALMSLLAGKRKFTSCILLVVTVKPYLDTTQVSLSVSQSSFEIEKKW